MGSTGKVTVSLSQRRKLRPRGKKEMKPNATLLVLRRLGFELWDFPQQAGNHP